MIMFRFGKHLFAAAGVLVMSATVFSQERLVIDVSTPQSSSSQNTVIHYGGTGSVRNSDERSYQAAQERRSGAEAQDRQQGAYEEGRQVGAAESRHSTGAAGERRAGGATGRHGSVRLDTIR